MESLRVINELRKKNEELEERIKEEMELRRNADTENEQLKERVKSLHDRLAEAYRIAGKELEE